MVDADIWPLGVIMRKATIQACGPSHKLSRWCFFEGKNESRKLLLLTFTRGESLFCCSYCLPVDKCVAVNMPIPLSRQLKARPPGAFRERDGCIEGWPRVGPQEELLTYM